MGFIPLSPQRWRQSFFVCHICQHKDNEYDSLRVTYVTTKVTNIILCMSSITILKVKKIKIYSFTDKPPQPPSPWPLDFIHLMNYGFSKLGHTAGIRTRVADLAWEFFAIRTTHYMWLGSWALPYLATGVRQKYYALRSQIDDVGRFNVELIKVIYLRM